VPQQPAIGPACCAMVVTTRDKYAQLWDIYAVKNSLGTMNFAAIPGGICTWE
jgi:hypothetical protein